MQCTAVARFRAIAAPLPHRLGSSGGAAARLSPPVHGLRAPLLARHRRQPLTVAQQYHERPSNIKGTSGSSSGSYGTGSYGSGNSSGSGSHGNSGSSSSSSRGSSIGSSRRPLPPGSLDEDAHTGSFSVSTLAGALSLLVLFQLPRGCWQLPPGVWTMGSHRQLQREWLAGALCG